jgi:hypothetical protein
VAATKTLHHLLPELIPPMDRRWTGAFFMWSTADPQYRQYQTFWLTYRDMITLARRATLPVRRRRMEDLHHQGPRQRHRRLRPPPQPRTMRTAGEHSGTTPSSPRDPRISRHGEVFAALRELRQCLRTPIPCSRRAHPEDGASHPDRKWMTLPTCNAWCRSPKTRSKVSRVQRVLSWPDSAISAGARFSMLSMAARASASLIGRHGQ